MTLKTQEDKVLSDSERLSALSVTAWLKKRALKIARRFEYGNSRKQRRDADDYFSKAGKAHKYHRAS